MKKIIVFSAFFALSHEVCATIESALAEFEAECAIVSMQISKASENQAKITIPVEVFSNISPNPLIDIASVNARLGAGFSGSEGGA